MVCTNIRPTKLKYPELLYADQCAKFIADFVTYEPSPHPTDLPTRLMSPDYVLRYQTGTCFELSTLLVSLLIGNGYDAYIVSGFATKQCCYNDQTFSDCPANLLNEFNELHEKEPAAVDRMDDNVSTVGVSKFWTMIEERNQADIAVEIRRTKEAEAQKIRELEKIPEDELFGKRVHGWVLWILNEKEWKFIESSTGLIHNVTDALYLQIESLWNHCNYWVNMKPSRSLSEISFDLTNVEDWNCILVAEPWNAYLEPNFYESHNMQITSVKHFQMPNSWVGRLEIPKGKYQERYSNKHKIIYYKKVKLERFSQFQEIGLSIRISKYHDYAFKQIFMTVNVFSKRDDKMVKCKINHRNGRTVQVFANGHKNNLKKLEFIEGALPVWDGMKMEFDCIKRIDNVTSTSICSSEMKTYFNNRSNQLLSRVVKFKTDIMVSKLDDLTNNIEEIIEIFGVNSRSKIQTIKFHSNQITIIDRFQNNELIQRKKLYSKLNCSHCEKKLTLHCECKEIMLQNDKYESLADLLKSEQKCLIDFTKLLHEVQEIFNSRKTF